jgi:hypothetical protein
MGGSPHKVTSFLGPECHNLIFYQTVNFEHRTKTTSRANLTVTASCPSHRTKADHISVKYRDGRFTLHGCVIL